MSDMKRGARLLGTQQPPAEYRSGTQPLTTEVPLWLQAQAAQRIGTAHGQAGIPSDLRHAFATRT